MWDLADALLSEVGTSTAPRECWTAILDRCACHLGLETRRRLERLDAMEGTREVRDQLAATFRSEPVPGDIGLLYFGLFDRVERGSGRVGAGFYVSGYGRRSGHGAQLSGAPDYAPEGRYLRSTFLDAIVDAGHGTRADAELVGYAVLAAAAAMLVRFGLPGSAPGLPVFVGFDEGDTFEVRPRPWPA